MSSNMCDTKCGQCRFWDFVMLGEIDDGDSRLMTLEKYGEVIGRDLGDNHGHGHGYGYRDDLVNYSFWTHHILNADGSTHYTVSDGPIPQLDPGQSVKTVHLQHECAAPPDRYRWVRAVCPICQTIYAAWFVLEPRRIAPEVDKRTYRIYDLSYFHAFNDEPSARDIETRIEWTPEMFVNACNDYIEKMKMRTA